MRMLGLMLAGLMTFGTLAVAQEANPESQRRGWNVPRSERERYGFGQERVKVEVAKDVEGKAPWMQRGQRGPRGPMMGRPGMRGPRGPMMMQKRFRGERAEQRVCPLCEKHKKAVSKKHVEKRGGRQGGPRHR